MCFFALISFNCSYTDSVRKVDLDEVHLEY